MKHTYQKSPTKTQKWKIKINEQKNDKIKNVQTKQNDLKGLWKHHWYFVLAIYSWEGPCPELWLLICSETPLEKMDFSFACRYQWQVASGSGMEAHVYFPLSVPGPHLDRTCTGLMCTASICEFTCAEVVWCMEDPVSLESTISGSLCSFRLPLHKDLWALKGW